MKCRRCNRTIPGTAKFCRYCGARTAGSAPRPPQNARNSRPGGRPNGRPGRRNQSAFNGYLVLRIVLIVICVGLVGIGIWKIPGNIRQIAASRPQNSQNKPTPVKEKEHTEETLSPADAQAVHALIEALDATGDTVEEATEDSVQAAFDACHDIGKDWFYVAPSETDEEVSES